MDEESVGGQRCGRPWSAIEHTQSQRMRAMPAEKMALKLRVRVAWPQVGAAHDRQEELWSGAMRRCSFCAKTTAAMSVSRSFFFTPFGHILEYYHRLCTSTTHMAYRSIIFPFGYCYQIAVHSALFKRHWYSGRQQTRYDKYRRWKNSALIQLIFSSDWFYF
jgi:hypothetical protein